MSADLLQDWLGIDLKIDPDTRDLVLDQVGEPETVAGNACLSQDLRHRIQSNEGVLGFIQREMLPGEVRDLRNLVELEVEQDPRVVRRSAVATLLQADQEGLAIRLEFLPVGADVKENLVVRLGGFG